MLKWLKLLFHGLNLAQLADANNTVDSLIKTCIEIKNITTQQCMMNTSQKINVLVEGTKGNVSIVNNEISQLALQYSLVLKKQQVTTKFTRHIIFNTTSCNIRS